MPFQACPFVSEEPPIFVSPEEDDSLVNGQLPIIHRDVAPRIAANPGPGGTASVDHREKRVAVVKGGMKGNHQGGGIGNQ
jgi:hypothetical protein